MNKITKIAELIFYILSIFFFIDGLVNYDIYSLDISIICLWIGNIFFSFIRIKSRVYFFALQITMFVFMLGRSVSNILLPGQQAYSISVDVLFHTKLCIFIALISLVLTYYIFEKIQERIKYSEENIIDYNSLQYNSVRNVSKYFVYATFVFSVLSLIDKTYFVMKNGYADLYLSYTPHIPYIFVKLGDSFNICFFVFLATMPTKRESRLPVILYLITAVLSLGTGKRQDFVVPIMLIVLYFFTRNTINKGIRPWLTKRMIKIGLISIPVFLVFLFSWNNIRFGFGEMNQNNVNTSFSFFQKLVGFFDELGFSANVISFEKMYEARIPDKLYSFGETIDYLRENVITQAFFDFPVYKSQNVERAMNSYNFTQIITYLRSSSYYLSGRGLGSSYIAEAYHDFGYTGIVFWSAIYSAVLCFGYNFKNKGIIFIALALTSLKYILLAPRNVASGFLTEWINLDNWLVIIAIFFVSNLVSNNRQKYLQNKV